MKHLGDITKINGSAAPPADVIIGGSPCQDLSVAGKRAGLAGERSGLFMEQIRIIKEMRKASERSGANDIKPRYMVWENVPGAFSSNKGQDFRAVLEETARIAEKDLPDIPVPSEGWHYSGLFMGEGWSIAWRVFDAQFWGVPQRRRRIALVADFGGFTAPEILFERKGVFGDSPPGGTSWKAFTAAAAKRFGGADKPGTEQISTTYCLQGNGIDRADTAGCNGKGWREDKSYTLNMIDRPAVYDARGNGDGETAPTITGDHENRVTDYTGVVCGTSQSNYNCKGKAYPILARDYKDPLFVCAAVDCRNITENNETNGTLQAKSNGGTSLNLQNVVRTQSLVRRLTPLECERLQGFPDNWTDIGAEYVGTDGKKRKVSDSARYKALGNSIALPPWAWLLERLSFYCGDDRTMASLFDGIGGFPLIWETLNGKGTCLWASEIEEFPIAVTKYHINHH